ncbi:MAG: hypothetical protein M3680_22025 [Myxococcota bacterium]|nr:hypothetical protein [Myxococcota bacterium]
MNGADDLRLLRTEARGSRALLRKLTTTSFGYFGVRGARSSDGLVRIVDVYSYNNGTWIADEMADALMSKDTEDPAVALTIGRVNRLDAEGKYGEALAALDTLPPAVLDARTIQSLRVAIAGRQSPEAHRQAMEERTRRRPADVPTPFEAMNRAFLAGDLSEALRQIDLVERAVGGDGALDAFRAGVLVQRARPGDLEDAARRAERLVRDEPALALGHVARLGVALARREWTLTLATIDVLESRFGIAFSDAAMRASPGLAELVQSAEFAAWSAARSR